jgi:hypothetical protein
VSPASADPQRRLIVRDLSNLACERAMKSIMATASLCDDATERFAVIEQALLSVAGLAAAAWAEMNGTHIREPDEKIVMAAMNKIFRNRVLKRDIDD